jgi:hypothetical protein
VRAAALAVRGASVPAQPWAFGAHGAPCRPEETTVTHPDISADGLSLPTWGARQVTRPSLRLSDWVVDPLERVMLVAVVLLGAVLLWMLATEQEPTGTTARDACVMTVLDEARAFAGVMGDDRSIPASFALGACAHRAG